MLHKHKQQTYINNLEKHYYSRDENKVRMGKSYDIAVNRPKVKQNMY